MPEVGLESANFHVSALAGDKAQSAGPHAHVLKPGMQVSGEHKSGHGVSRRPASTRLRCSVVDDTAGQRLTAQVSEVVRCMSKYHFRWATAFVQVNKAGFRLEVSNVEGCMLWPRLLCNSAVVTL